MLAIVLKDEAGTIAFSSYLFSPANRYGLNLAEGIFERMRGTARLSIVLRNEPPVVSEKGTSIGGTHSAAPLAGEITLNSAGRMRLIH